MFPASEIERLLKAALPDGEIRVRDLTGASDHYEVTVVSSAFAGRSLVERHRMIYGPLAEPLKGPIHALTLRTLTPDENKR